MTLVKLVILANLVIMVKWVKLAIPVILVKLVIQTNLVILMNLVKCYPKMSLLKLNLFFFKNWSDQLPCFSTYVGPLQVCELVKFVEFVNF